jgi:hypothetical protein
MAKKVKDRILDVPAEANRDKHMNYSGNENNEPDPSVDPPTAKITNKDMKNKSRNRRSK